jgi:hypothetical protein
MPSSDSGQDMFEVLHLEISRPQNWAIKNIHEIFTEIMFLKKLQI